jgi:hypothetical protein
LNALITPNDRFTVQVAGVSKQYKHTISQAQQSFIQLISKTGDLNVKLSEIQEQYTAYNWKLQPMIFVVGKDLLNIESSYAVYDGIFYKCEKFIDALDMCYKMYRLFNLDYQKASTLMWLFIQNYFYDMKEVNDRKSSKINILIQNLKEE